MVWGIFELGTLPLPLKSGLFRTDIASILSAQTPLIKAFERPSSYLACFCSKSEIIASRFATSCFSLLISEVNSSFNFRQISVALSLHTKIEIRGGGGNLTYVPRSTLALYFALQIAVHL